MRPFPFAFLGGAWSPTLLPSLQLWLRADKGVTQGGGSVTAWADQSGNGNNATASGSPALSNTGGPNSQAAIQKGNSDYFTIPYAAGLQPTTAVSVLAVWRWSGASHNSSGGVVSMATASSWSDAWALVNGPGGTAGELEFFVNNYASHYGQLPHLNDNTSWVASSGVYDSTVPDLNLYKSNDATGVNKSGATTAGTISYSAHSQLVIGGYTNAGGTGAVSAAPAQDFAEIVVSGAAWSSSDRTKLQAYINARYGL